MGLFKKRSGDPDEIARLRSEITAMAQRLDESHTAEVELGGQVAELTSRLDETTARLDEATAPDDEEAVPDDEEYPDDEPPAPVSQTDHDELTARVSQLADQLTAAIEAGEEAAEHESVDPEQVDALVQRVDALAARLDTPLPTPPPPPPPTDSDDTEVDLTPIEDRIDELLGRIDAVDARVTSISNELANQLSEINGELATRADAPAPTDEVVDELRDAQVRIANEQARYQIAFRQDLADLAARLRRA